MDCPVSFCANVCGQINWLMYMIAVVAVYAVGAVWYSFLFSKAWMKVFKIDMPEKPSAGNMVATMFFQLLATALFGLVFFVLVKISVWIAVLALFGFIVWQKASLKFRFYNLKEFVKAAGIEVGYMTIAGIVFILFGLL